MACSLLDPRNVLTGDILASMSIQRVKNVVVNFFHFSSSFLTKETFRARAIIKSDFTGTIRRKFAAGFSDVLRFYTYLNHGFFKHHQ
jgi:hypothetical protein